MVQCKLIGPLLCGRHEKEFATIRVKTVVTRISIQEKDVKYLQYLDVLRKI